MRGTYESLEQHLHLRTDTDWDLFVGLKMTGDLFHTEAREKGYAPRAKHLDTAQLFKHVYVIYNALFYTGELPLTERVKLCLCV